MDSVQRYHLFNYGYNNIFSPDKAMEELSESVLRATEVEETMLKALEEITLRDKKINQLKEMLAIAISERDEARQECQKLDREKMLLHKQLLLLQQQSQASSKSGISSNVDNSNRLSPSGCDESIVSSPARPAPEISDYYPLVIDKALPERGQFLKAVIKAGPLLQTLMLAGPLPKWRHPPPRIDARQIPPPPPPSSADYCAQALEISSNSAVVSDNCGTTNSRKRLGEEGFDSLRTELMKYQ